VDVNLELRMADGGVVPRVFVSPELSKASLLVGDPLFRIGDSPPKSVEFSKDNSGEK
jgi:hypothetical protein